MHGLSIQFFFISSILWTTAIAVNIFLVAVLKKDIKDIERYEYVFHIVIWILSLSLTVPLYILDNNNQNSALPIMGNATLWCWITNDYGKYRMIFFFGPLWFVFLFNAVIYISLEVICRKRRKNNNYNDICDDDQSNGKSVVKKSNLYLLILFIIW